MTIVVLATVGLAALSYLLGAYFRVSERDLLHARELWKAALPEVERFIDRQTVPDVVAKNVVMFSAVAGCGCVTMVMLRDFFTGSIRRKYALAKENEVPRELADLADEDKHALAHVMVSLLIFDTYHAPIAGRILRFLVRQPLPTLNVTEQDGELEGIRSVMFSANEAADRAARSGKVPPKLLAAA